MAMAAGTAAKGRVSDATRWTQLICCIICMIMIANLQYGWTLFVNPINKAHGWTIASIQVAFAIFIALETWLTPVEGWIVDILGPKRGPKFMVAFGGIMVAIGWVLNSRADTLTELYIGAVLSGIGGGAIYATCVGQAVKWFPDRRGLAVGLTAAGYGAGSALSVIPIREVIAAYDYQTAFLWFGIIQGGIAFLLAWILRGPEPGELAAARCPEGRARNPQLFAFRGSQDARVLAALHHVRHGFGQRLDGDGSDRADREGLQCRKYHPVRRCVHADRGADRR